MDTTGSKDIIHLAKEKISEIFSTLDDAYAYHNLEHTHNVYEASIHLSEAAGLPENEREMLLLTALFHDTGFIANPHQHEAESARIAEAFLKAHSYPENQINRIKQCILATRKDAERHTKLEKLAVDADMAGLAATDYDKRANALRKEINAFNQARISKDEWLKTNIKFLENHNYLTEEGQRLFDIKKTENLAKLIQERKLKKERKLLTIGSSKNAQTQFKTALRNHIDLSAIADNKANIMLSVNALILTVAIPILINQIELNPRLLIPTIILGFVCTVSMIYATLATRPGKMKGSTNLQEVLDNRSNLFFFGNFHKMGFDDYIESMEKVVSDNNLLDQSIIRDLFFLGKALGSKYQNLRYCYNIFMYGIILTIIAFGLVHMV